MEDVAMLASQVDDAMKRPGTGEWRAEVAKWIYIRVTSVVL